MLVTTNSDIQNADNEIPPTSITTNNNNPSYNGRAVSSSPSSSITNLTLSLPFTNTSQQPPPYETHEIISPKTGEGVMGRWVVTPQKGFQMVPVNEITNPTPDN